MKFSQIFSLGIRALASALYLLSVSSLDHSSLMYCICVSFVLSLLCSSLYLSAVLLSQLFIATDLPRTATGKIQRRIVAAHFLGTEKKEEKKQDKKDAAVSH